MEKSNNVMGIVLALIVGLIIGYFIGTSDLKVNDQGAAVRSTEVAGVAELVDPAVLEAAIKANPEAEIVSVRDRNGNLAKVPVQKKVFLLGGIDPYAPTTFSDVWSSPDGLSWTQVTANAPWGPRVFSASVFFKNKIWVIGGDQLVTTINSKNDVWSSADGINWTQVTANAPWTPRQQHSAVVFNNKIWIMGGLLNTGPNYASDVWSSPDGINWTQETANAPWGTRKSFVALVFNNKIWVIGGELFGVNAANDVWSSPDGINWTQILINAPWPVRAEHVGLVFSNKMWIMSGNNYGAYFPTMPVTMNDVWSSPDGITWTQKTASAQWNNRSFAAGVTFNGKLHIMGGNWPAVSLNDVWSSGNGTNWTQVTGNAPWSGRFGHNIISTPLTFGQKADLIVETLQWAENSMAVLGNDPVQVMPSNSPSFQPLLVEIKMKNTGTASANLPVGTKINLYKTNTNTGNLVGQYTINSASTLGVGLSQAYTFTPTVNLKETVGTFNLIAQVDKPSLVSELDENNNKLTEVFTVVP